MPPIALREVAPAVAAKGPESPSVSAIYETGPATELLLPAPAAVGAAAGAAAGTPTLRVATTCYQIFESACAARPNEPIWFSRAASGSPLVPTTHSEAAEQVAALAAALASLGVKKGDRVGILGANAPEWMIAMQACNRRGYVVTPVYDTLGESAVRFTISHGGLRAIVASADKLPALAQAVAGFKGKSEAPTLSDVIVWGSGGEAQDAAAAAKATAAITSLKSSPLGALKTLDWAAALELGRSPSTAALRAADPPTADDVSTLMFTSGTTGQPKGVVFTHAGLVAAVAALDGTTSAPAPRGFAVGDRYFSFLTLAHVFGRCAEEFCLARGVVIYYCRDMRRFNQEVAEARPTLMCGVPRILERVSQGIDDAVGKVPHAQQLAFNVAVAAKRALQRFPALASRFAGKPLPIIDTVVLAPARKALGGSVRAIVSGAAPLPGHVFSQLQAVFGAPVVEAYGLTETAAASFCAIPWRADQAGRVGLPCPGVQVKLESVPEMNYEAAPGLVVAGGGGASSSSSSSSMLPRGEVLIRSPALFREYYGNPEATAAALTPDGFFRTGDIGELDPRSGLKIIDRKKNIFKLSQGEYVAAEKIEMALERCPLVEQLFVYGNSFESVLVAVVVPRKRTLLEWWSSSGGGAADASLEQVCADPKASAHVLAELTAAARAAGLLGFEIPKAVHLESRGLWSVEDDLLTPTLKKKRPQLQKRYQAEIDGMYARLKAAEAAKKAGGEGKAAAAKPAAA